MQPGFPGFGEALLGQGFLGHQQHQHALDLLTAVTSGTHAAAGYEFSNQSMSAFTLQSLQAAGGSQLQQQHLAGATAQQQAPQSVKHSDRRCKGCNKYLNFRCGYSLCPKCCYNTNNHPCTMHNPTMPGYTHNMSLRVYTKWKKEEEEKRQGKRLTQGLVAEAGRG